MNDPRGLTHLDADGTPRMVDVGAKSETARVATAEGALRMSPEAFAAVREGKGPKGDALAVARLAGIMGGKRTPDLIPLCHALPGASMEVDLDLDPELPGVRVRATASYTGKTGVEMEALVSASVALLTVYDMAKAVDKGMEIQTVRLVAKSGGKSGPWARQPDTDPTQG